MSKPSNFDYEKEIKQSLKDGAVITFFTVGGYMILKYIFKLTPPTAKLDLTDVGKLGAGISTGVLLNDYAKNKKWI